MPCADCGGGGGVCPLPAMKNLKNLIQHGKITKKRLGPPFSSKHKYPSDHPPPPKTFSGSANECHLIPGIANT